jgi:hypothetical protein
MPQARECDDRDVAVEGLRLSDVLAPLLAGKGPDVQGVALANLLAMWIAGHPKEARLFMLKLHMALVLDLVELEESNRAEL